MALRRYRAFFLFQLAFLPCILATPLALCAEEAFRYPEKKSGGGELKYIDGIPVLSLEGTPEEMGRQRGELMAQPAGPLLEYPKKLLQRYRLEAAWPMVTKSARQMLPRLPEDHRKELEAALAGRGVDADTLLVANTLLELRRIGGCSALIVTPEHTTVDGPLFGRNFDFDGLDILHKYSLVVVQRPKGKRAFAAIGFPGIVGVFSGMNDAGLAVATLDVYSTADGATRFDPTGTPLAFTFRRILEECATMAEAEKLLRESKRTTYMNLAVCDKEGGVVFELTPKSVVARRGDKCHVACTNHFRAKGLATSTNCRRYDILARCEELPQIGLADMRRLLDAVNQDAFTIQTMVFEPRAGKVHLSIGGPPPTSAHELVPLDVRGLLER